jgi:hypothetical protein
LRQDDIQTLARVLLYASPESRRRLAVRLSDDERAEVWELLAETARSSEDPLLRARCVEVLGLAGLGLTGEIPQWLSANGLEWLEGLWLDGNELGGTIPASLGTLHSLDSLNIADNQLTGDIPAEIANAGRIGTNPSLLGALVISGNEDLTGPVPMSLTENRYLRVFHYDATNVCEPVAGAFHEWIESIDSDPPAWLTPNVYTSVLGTDIPCGPVSTEDYADLPGRFELHQNYPNPFNPTTTIKYEIPADGMPVILRVYNALGQHVATLVNEVKMAGQYEMSFDGKGLASGHYIYRLMAGDRVQTHSMMLIK